MIDFATLAMRVENQQAVKNLDDTAKAIDNVDAKTKKLTVSTEQGRQAWAKSAGDMGRFAQELSKIAQQEEAVTQKSNRLAQSMQRMREAARVSVANADILARDPFQQTAKGLVEVEKAAAKTGPLLNALRGPLTGLTAAALELNPAVAGMAARLGVFSIGAPEIVAVLAGLAAVAFAWEKITAKTRAAKEETEKALARLTDLANKQKFGEFGQDLTSVGLDIQRVRRERAMLQGLNANGGGFIAGGHKDEIDALNERERLLVNAYRAGVNAQLETLREGNKKAADDRREALDKEWKDWQDAQARKIDLMKSTEDVLTRIQREGAETRKRNAELNDLDIRVGVGREPGAARTPISGFTFGAADFAMVGRLQSNAAKDLSDAALRLKVAADEQQKAALKSIAANAAFGLASHIGGGVGALGSAIQGGLSGAAGGPWGVAIGLVSSLASNVINLGRSSKEAAERMKQMKDSLTDTILGWRAALGDTGAGTQQSANRIHAEAEAARNALRDIYKGYDPVTGLGPVPGSRLKPEALAEYQRQLAEINRLEQQRIAALGDEAKALQKANLQESIKGLTSLIDSLAEFKGSLSLSDLSPLSPMQKLSEARRQYEEILGKARTGDQTAAGQLPQFARAFLEASRSVNASGIGYQQTFARVVADTDEVMKIFEGQRDIAQKQLDVLMGIRDGNAETGREQIHRMDLIVDGLTAVVDAVIGSGESRAVEEVFAT